MFAFFSFIPLNNLKFRNLIYFSFAICSLQLEQLIELFDREQITLEILAEMTHEDLKQVGVSAYGFRHKILKGIATLGAKTGKIITFFQFAPNQRPNLIQFGLFFKVLANHQIQVHF